MYRRDGKTGRRGRLCEFQGSRLRLKRSPASSSFPFLRSLRGPGIAVSKAAARMSKTKVSFFSLEGPGYRRATAIHFLLFPFSFLFALPPSCLVIVFCFPSMFHSLSSFLPGIPAIPNSFSCSMYYLWLRQRPSSFRLSTGFCLKELVLAHFAQDPFSLPRPRLFRAEGEENRKRTFLEHGYGHSRQKLTRLRKLRRRLVPSAAGNNCTEKLKIPRLR